MAQDFTVNLSFADCALIINSYSILQFVLHPARVVQQFLSLPIRPGRTALHLKVKQSITNMQKCHGPSAVNCIVTAWFEELDEQSDETIVEYVSGMLEDPESLEWDDLEELVAGASAAFSSMNSATRQCKLLDMVQQVGIHLAAQDGAGSH